MKVYIVVWFELPDKEIVDVCSSRELAEKSIKEIRQTYFDEDEIPPPIDCYDIDVWEVD
ncbi:MAG: hypothetical protein GY834_09210 [Bacteroidetes bacterium]|nr:hypothetical protein [Bacteroidota bacterium]